MIDMPPRSPGVGADTVPTEKTTVRLDPERKSRVIEWGGGDASAGIRFAIDKCNEFVSGGMDPRRRILSVMMLPANATDQRIFIEILDSVLRVGEGALKVAACRNIVIKNEKKPDLRKNILRRLVRDGFLEQSVTGFRPVVRSNQIVDMDRFHEILRDYRNYLRGTGKFGNMLDGMGE